MRAAVGAVAGTLAVLALVPAAASAQLPPLLPTPPSPPPSNPAPGPAPPAPASQPGSTTAGVNAGRTGHLDDPHLVSPLETRWTRTLAGNVRSVVYGDGLIYAAIGAAVTALDPATGRTVWHSPGAQTAGGLAFDDGVVVSADDDKRIRGRAARTGAVLWETRVSQYYSLDSSPVAHGGVVYIGDSDRVGAYSVHTGGERWTAKGNGTDNPVATDGARVFASYACGWTYAWTVSGGSQSWRHSGSCSGGGGSMPVVHQGRVYVGENHTIYDAASGAILGTFRGGAPITAGNLGVFPDAGSLRAIDLTTKRQKWLVRNLAVGNLQAHENAIGIGRSIYALGDSSRLYVHSLDTGGREQSIRLRASRSSDSRAPMASAPGLLLVPAGGRLTAYQSVYRPAAMGVVAQATESDFVFGKRGSVAGVVGTGLRASRRVSIQVRPHRSRRYRTLGPLSTVSDGYFQADLKLPRNSRVRVAVGAARSVPVRFYVYPRYRLKVRRARRNPNRIKASVRIAVPRGVAVAGRRVVLYNAQPRRKRYVRLGSARVRRAGRGKGVAAVRFNALRRVGRRDFLILCIPKASSRLGMGRPDTLDRRCGRRKIALR